MGYLKYLRESWKRPRETLDKEYRNKLTQWRKENTVERIERPTRVDRARSLGYKAKQGFVVARSRVRRNSSRNPTIRSGRQAGNLSPKMVLSKNDQTISEEKAQKRFPNLEVLNSYWVGEDAMFKWYEVILVDVFHPQIQNDSKINWLVSNKHKRRGQRGLTSAAKKSRGLNQKGRGAEKVRPSVKSNKGKLR